MMPQIENRMANDFVWENLERRKLNGAGYLNPRTGVFVSEENALEYMVEILKNDPDKAEDMMEYFYRNWEKEEQKR